MIRRQGSRGQSQGSSSSFSSWSNDPTATLSPTFQSSGKGTVDPPEIPKGSSIPQLFAPWESSPSSANDQVTHTPPRYNASDPFTSSSPISSQSYGLLQQSISPRQHTHNCEEPTQQTQHVQLPSTLFPTSPQTYETAAWSSSEGAGGFFHSIIDSEIGTATGSNYLEVDFGDLIFNPPTASSSHQAAMPIKTEPAVHHELNESDEELSPMKGVYGFLGEETAFISKVSSRFRPYHRISSISRLSSTVGDGV